MKADASQRSMSQSTPGAITKQLLIAAGEHLFGLRGLDATSLREIAAVAGQSNSNVVQYHFGGKAGLIQAILVSRAIQLEAVRAESLQQLNKGGAGSPRELLKILWSPNLTVRDERGCHIFCHFLLQYMIYPDSVQKPLSGFNQECESPAAFFQECSALATATRQLRDCYAQVPDEVFNFRMPALTMMFLSTVVEYDKVRLYRKHNNNIPDSFDIEPVLDMAIAALGA